LQKLQEFRRKAPNRPRTQKEWYSLAKAIGRWFAGEGDVGEASRFASSVRNEQSETLRLHIEPSMPRSQIKREWDAVPYWRSLGSGVVL
jgi:hypothetical protein